MHIYVSEFSSYDTNDEYKQQIYASEFGSYESAAWYDNVADATHPREP